MIPSIEEKNVAIAEMLQWKWWPVQKWHQFKKFSGAFEAPNGRIGYLPCELRFHDDGNWQLYAIEWIEKKGYEVMVHGCFVEIYDTSNDEYSEYHYDNKGDAHNKKEAIFEALYQFSEYLKKKE